VHLYMVIMINCFGAAGLATGMTSILPVEIYFEGSLLADTAQSAVTPIKQKLKVVVVLMDEFLGE